MVKKAPWFLLLAFFAAGAQDITPNAGFEEWTTISIPTQYEIPDGWDQLNEETNFIGILTCVKSTDAHSGEFAAKLITKSVTILGQTDTANGIITTGHLITVPPYGVNGGIPYQQRPDSIYGWIKYAPTPGDSCQIQLDLFNVNNDTIGRARYQTAQTITTYTRFSAPVEYFLPGHPDTARWLISSSNGFKSLPNSTLYVDDIGIVSSVAVEEVYFEGNLSVYPNPAGESFMISRHPSAGGILRLSDEAGRMIREWNLKQATGALSLKDVSPGVYILTWMNPQPVAVEKIIIQ